MLLAIVTGSFGTWFVPMTLVTHFGFCKFRLGFGSSLFLPSFPSLLGVLFIWNLLRFHHFFFSPLSYDGPSNVKNKVNNLLNMVEFYPLLKWKLYIFLHSGRNMWLKMLDTCSNLLVQKEREREICNYIIFLVSLWQDENWLFMSATFSWKFVAKWGHNNRGVITSWHRGGGHNHLYRQIDFQWHYLTDLSGPCQWFLYTS
jgi:hypothetical protein